MNMQRRSFLTYFSVGWAASCFPLVLSACSDASQKKASTETAKSSEAPTGDVALAAPAAGFKVVGDVAKLDKDGSVGNDKVLVIRDPANRNKVLAVNPSCTHKGCTVKWKAAQKNFECPCHDAHFAPDGKTKSGPVTKPLPTYSAKIENGKVLVKLS